MSRPIPKKETSKRRSKSKSSSKSRSRDKDIHTDGLFYRNYGSKQTESFYNNNHSHSHHSKPSLNYHAKGICEHNNKTLANVLSGKSPQYIINQLIICKNARINFSETKYTRIDAPHTLQIITIKRLLAEVQDLLKKKGNDITVYIGYSGSVSKGFNIGYSYNTPPMSKGGYTQRSKSKSRRSKSRRSRRSR